MATLKDIFGASTSFTITLGSLASSTAGVGRQSTIVDNTSTAYTAVWIAVNVKMGTTPNSNALVYIYLIRDDNNGTNIRDDGAGASDAGLTVLNAPLIGTLTTKSSAATGDVLKGIFYVQAPGPKFGIAVVNATGVALDATNGNHVINYVGETYSIV
jgi:hypothetical protein